MLEYQNALTQKLDYQQSTHKELETSIEKAVSSFEKNNPFLEKIVSQKLIIEDYHGLLLRLFQQVWRSSSSFALAAASVDMRHQGPRDYLLHHAEEEKSHWVWILNDLSGTGYKGADPRTVYAPAATTAYYSYAMFLAAHFPIGRLCMAAVLEGISGTFGPKYGPDIVKILKIKPEYMQFFKSHGELDQGHSQDIIDVLRKTELTGFEYWQLIGVAQTTVELYKAIYS